MLRLVVLFLFPLIFQTNGCVCQQCCRYLMAPSTVYVQMNPSAYGIIPPPTSASTTAHPSTTSANHIFANQLQWVIMTNKPWNQGNNIYYAVSAQPTAHHGDTPTIDFNQPTLYFMPNWWNKIQQAAGIPNNSPFAIQLNGAPMPPSEAPHSTSNYHSYPPQNADHMDTNHDAQPAATITVFNEEPDLLPQSAKAAQELLQQIQLQLQKLNHQDQVEPTKHIDTPTTHESKDQSKTAKDDKPSPETIPRPELEKPQPEKPEVEKPKPTSEPTARIVSADKASESSEEDGVTEKKHDESTKPLKNKKDPSDEAPARSPQRFSHEAGESEPRRKPTSSVIRERKYETYKDDDSEYRKEHNSSAKDATTSLLFILLVTQSFAQLLF